MLKKLLKKKLCKPRTELFSWKSFGKGRVLEFETTGRKMILLWKVCWRSNERGYSWENRHLSCTPTAAGGMSGTDITLPLTSSCWTDKNYSHWQQLMRTSEWSQFHKRSLLELKVAFLIQKYCGELEMLPSLELRQEADIFETFANL